VWSGFYLYEIDEITVPKEMFRLEASNNKNLEVVPLPENTEANGSTD